MKIAHRLLLPGILVVLVQAVFVLSAYGQAAVEYGAAASKSTAMTSQAATALGSRVQSAFSGGQRTPLKIPTAASKNLDAVMQENRQKFEEKGKETGGTVHVESVPRGATIAVDGQPVGYSPLDLKLPEGKHQLELTRPDFEPWRMEVTASPQESTSVKAPLKNRYKGVVTIAIN